MRAALLASMLAAGAVAAPAGAACRQALAIGLDVSGSVDGAEYRLQADGLANALLSADVVAAFLDEPAIPVRLYVYEWSGPNSQRALVDWTDITALQDLEAIAARLRAVRQVQAELQTAIGRALIFGARQAGAQAECWKRTIDLTGDGRSNIGPAPDDPGLVTLLSGMTVNALVIGQDAARYQNFSQSEIMDLTTYFAGQVIRGPDAFVEAAVGFEDFEAAMERKLLRELETISMGGIAPAPGSPADARGAGATVVPAALRSAPGAAQGGPALAGGQ